MSTRDLQDRCRNNLAESLYAAAQSHGHVPPDLQRGLWRLVAERIELLIQVAIDRESRLKPQDNEDNSCKCGTEMYAVLGRCQSCFRLLR